MNMVCCDRPFMGRCGLIQTANNNNITYYQQPFRVSFATNSEKPVSISGPWGTYKTAG